MNIEAHWFRRRHGALSVRLTFSVGGDPYRWTMHTPFHSMYRAATWDPVGALIHKASLARETDSDLPQVWEIGEPDRE